MASSTLPREAVKNWTVVTPSDFAHEQEALEFLRLNLGQRAVRAWSNFEFFAPNGAIYEVDLLLLTRYELVLVEIKSWSGEIVADPQVWEVQRHPGTPFVPLDNPLFLANKKAKILKGMLTSQKQMKAPGVKMPYVRAVAFLSDPTGKLRLHPALEGHVAGRDKIVDVLGEPGRAGTQMLDVPSAKALLKSMEELGLSKKPGQRKVGEYVLAELLGEGSSYQDYRARHFVTGELGRIRLYNVAGAASPDQRERVSRAALRESTLLEGLEHPGLLRPRYYFVTDLGPALLFDFFPEAERLDHFVLQQRDKLDQATRLNLVRQLGEVLRHAHDNKRLHRSLAPQNVLVLDPKSPLPRLKVFNWHTGTQQDGTQGTSHVSDLLDDPVTAYLAPEVVQAPEAAGEAADVFSLGAVAFFLLTGTPPGERFLDMCRRLQHDRGLRAAGVADGISANLDSAVAWATHPDLAQRLGTVEEFLDMLATAERAPAEETRVVKHPEEARPGDSLPGGLRVVERLGRGAVSLALLVDRDGQEMVLKVAHDVEHNARLLEEGEVLRKLEHRQIVRLLDEVQVGERHGLLLTRAGDRTLAQRLRQEGRLQLELLRRFGEDLIGLVAYLEETGIVHRDLKPANLGVAKVGEREELHLVLFDFSLSRTAADNIFAGTRGYLDPFLKNRTPPRWDSAAERYAAAVTLYEMAAGDLPRWGDGQSDAALLPEAELHLESGRFDPSLREGLTAFFQQALARDPAQRFDHAEQMLEAWRRALAPAGESVLGSTASDAERLRLWEEATLGTSVSALGLSEMANRALDQAQVLSVKDLLSLPGTIIVQGLGQQTRREIQQARDELRRRFPTVDVDLRKHADERGLDRVVDRLVRPSAAYVAPDSARLREVFFGLETQPGDPFPHWPTATELARRLQLEVTAVLKLMPGWRVTWGRSGGVTRLRSEIADLLTDAGGVLGAEEVAQALLARQGSLSNDPHRRRQLAAAALRAALEVESLEEDARFLYQRHGERVLVAATPELLAYALQLGQEADTLAGAEPLLPPYRVVEHLAAVASPGDPLSPSRLVRLAAAASQRAAVSSRQELYPRGMPARRALELAHGALLGAARIQPDEVQARVASRYPEAEPLPARPALDELLSQAGWNFHWSTEERSYLRADAERGLSSLSSSSLHRYPTTGDRGPVTPEVAEAREFEERLGAAWKRGAFLALAVTPAHALEAQRSLESSFELTVHSLDALLLDALRNQATKARIKSWDTVLEADREPPGSPARTRLQQLVGRAMPEVEAALEGSGGTLLLTDLGLLARYDRMDLLEKLRDRVTQGSLQGCWLVACLEEGQNLPAVDGKPIPVLTTGQHARIPTAWLRNAHRGRSQESAGSGPGRMKP